MQTNERFASIMNTSMSYKIKMFDMIESKDCFVLDFGAGSGVLGILYAMTYPNATVYLWDELSEMREIMKDNISSAKIANAHVIDSCSQLELLQLDYVLMSSVVHELVALESEEHLFEKTLSFLSTITKHIIIRDGLKIDDECNMSCLVKDKERFNEFMDALELYKDQKINVVRDEIMDGINITEENDDIYLRGKRTCVHNLLNKMTWGIASLEREIKENFLCNNKQSLEQTIQQVNLKYETRIVLDQFIEIKQEDYFDYIQQMVHIDKEWNTHFICLLSTCGEL